MATSNARQLVLHTRADNRENHGHLKMNLVFNGNIVQAPQRVQNAATANHVSAVVAPRVVRVGLIVQ